MTTEELRVTLELHALWIKTRFDSETKGRYADLSGADLSDANLRCANLSGANLSGADMSGANLRCADMSGANLSGADMSDANLRCADMSDANLSGADLRYANLSGANLRCADLSGANYNHVTSFFALQCPECGEFIGFKKCGKYIIKLKITENAKRSSATTRKCRCSEALVLEIQNIDGTVSGLTQYLHEDNYTPDGTLYEVGKIVKPLEDFNEDRWNECASGIHFFITRNEAVRY